MFLDVPTKPHVVIDGIFLSWLDLEDVMLGSRVCDY